MTSHVAAKEHETPGPVWSACKTQCLIEVGKKDLKKCLRNLGEKILKKCSQTYARLQGSRKNGRIEETEIMALGEREISALFMYNTQC